MAITTTGGLRAFVAKTLEDLQAGRVEIDKATLVVKLSGRITESLYAEAKIQKLLIENGREPGALGTQLLGEPGAPRG